MTRQYRFGTFFEICTVVAFSIFEGGVEYQWSFVFKPPLVVESAQTRGVLIESDKPLKIGSPEADF